MEGKNVSDIEQNADEMIPKESLRSSLHYLSTYLMAVRSGEDVGSLDRAKAGVLADFADEIAGVVQDILKEKEECADKNYWYQSILDAVPYPIHVTDADMRWTFMNKIFEDLLIQNKVISDRKSAYGKPCSTADATICNTAECGIHQLRTTGKDETYFEWLGTISKQKTAAIFDRSGNTVGYVETVQDLTEQLNKIAYYESILDAVPYPIHVTDTDMKWTYMNKTFEDLLIQNKVISDRKSAYGMPCKTANANICGTEECGIHQLRTTGKNETYFEWLGTISKQTTAPVLDAKGNTVGYVETVYDLTEQLNKIAYYESILDAVPFPIHVTDTDMKWTYINKTFEGLLIQNKVITDRKSAYGKPCSTANANICGTSECGIHQLKTTGKNETYFEWLGASCKQTTAPIRDIKKQIVGYVETVQDLTEQMNQIAYYESILDAVPYPIHVTDLDMRWKYMNKAFEDTLIKNRVITDRKSAYGMPCKTANASICGTSECGIQNLCTTGKNETYFEWLGASDKQTTAPVMNAKGEKVGYVETVLDLTEQISLIKYLKMEVTRISENLSLLNSGNFNLNMTLTAADSYTEQAKEMFEGINISIEELLKNLKSLMQDSEYLAEEAIKGNLTARADSSKHPGEFRKILDGLNRTLDSVVIPVQESIRISKKYANYDFTARFDPNIPISGEWIEFRSDLNNIGIQVSAAVNLINQRLTELITGSEEANASIEEVASGAQQIAANTVKVNQNAEQGNEGIGQILSAMEDLNQTVAAVSQKTESVSVASTQANDLAKGGINLAKKSEDAMKEISKTADEVDTIVKDINLQMDEIGKIVRLISDIANQTNLLALNAAIEAARAGEAGRGFAVVASEVKSLAQDSRQSAENIEDMISTLQSKTKQATEAMGKSTTAVGDGEKALEETVKAFTNIATTIEDINKNTLEVASSSEEQAASVEEVTASIQEVSHLLQNTAKESGDAAASTEEAAASIDEVGKIVNNVVVHVENISQEITKFTV